MNILRVRRLFAGESVARFAVSGPGGHPHLMPVPIAVIDDGADGVITAAVDQYPRSLTATARLRDVEAHPRVSFMADHPERSDAPWWVHAEAVAEVLRPGRGDPRWEMATTALAEHHAQLRRDQRHGVVIWATVISWTGWTAVLDAAA